MSSLVAGLDAGPDAQNASVPLPADTRPHTCPLRSSEGASPGQAGGLEAPLSLLMFSRSFPGHLRPRRLQGAVHRTAAH